MKRSADDNCLFNDILDEWLKERKNDEDLKIQSYQRYESLIDSYIRDTLGVKKCSEIVRDDIIDFFRKGRMKYLGISVKKSVLSIIKSALDMAYVMDKGLYIDLKKIKFKARKQEIVVFTRKEQREIDKYLTTEMNVRKLVLIICMYTGIRVGEACGLKWGDIDFEKRSLHINRTAQRIKIENDTGKKTILITSTPKSETSSRIIPLPNFIFSHLNKFRMDDDVFILTESKVKIYDTRLLESFYKRTLTKCGIQHLKFHTLRHTFATRCVESGIDAKTLSEILGHSSVEITLKLYVHPTYDMKKKSIEKTVRFIKNVECKK